MKGNLYIPLCFPSQFNFRPSSNPYQAPRVATAKKTQVNPSFKSSVIERKLVTFILLYKSPLLPTNQSSHHSNQNGQRYRRRYRRLHPPSRSLISLHWRCREHRRRCRRRLRRDGRARRIGCLRCLRCLVCKLLPRR